MNGINSMGLPHSLTATIVGSPCCAQPHDFNKMCFLFISGNPSQRQVPLETTGRHVIFKHGGRNE